VFTEIIFTQLWHQFISPLVS